LAPVCALTNKTFIYKFEVQINDNAQYRGKKAPHGKERNGVEPVNHHKKQQGQHI
jgi:hypothetical protein